MTFGTIIFKKSFDPLKMETGNFDTDLDFIVNYDFENEQEQIQVQDQEQEVQKETEEEIPTLDDDAIAYFLTTSYEEYICTFTFPVNS